jgi:hypothetical protein
MRIVNFKRADLEGWVAREKRGLLGKAIFPNIPIMVGGEGAESHGARGRVGREEAVRGGSAPSRSMGRPQQGQVGVGWSVASGLCWGASKSTGVSGVCCQVWRSRGVKSGAWASRARTRLPRTLPAGWSQPKSRTRQNPLGRTC